MPNQTLLKVARARVQARAAAAQIPVPARLLDEACAPSDALLEFCRERFL